LHKNKAIILIGAAGSFDIIANMNRIVPLKEGFVQLPIKDFDIIKKELLVKT